MKLTRNDYLLIIGIAIVFLVGVFAIKYYIAYTTEECLQDPFIFGAKQLEDITTGKFQGTGYIKNDLGIGVVIINFNSTDLVQVPIS